MLQYDILEVSLFAVLPVSYLCASDVRIMFTSTESSLSNLQSKLLKKTVIHQCNTNKEITWKAHAAWHNLKCPCRCPNWGKQFIRVGGRWMIYAYKWIQMTSESIPTSQLRTQWSDWPGTRYIGAGNDDGWWWLASTKRGVIHTQILVTLKLSDLHVMFLSGLLTLASGKPTFRNHLFCSQSEGAWTRRLRAHSLWVIWTSKPKAGNLLKIKTNKSLVFCFMYYFLCWWLVHFLIRNM